MNLKQASAESTLSPIFKWIREVGVGMAAGRVLEGTHALVLKL